MALGVVLRYPTAAIGGGLACVFLVELLLAEMLRNVAGVDEILELLPGVAVSELAQVFHYASPGLGSGTALVDGTRGLITVLVYVVLFIAAGLLVFNRRDVTA